MESGHILFLVWLYGPECNEFHLFSWGQPDGFWPPDVDGRPDLRQEPHEPNPTRDIGEKWRHWWTLKESVRRKVTGVRTFVVRPKWDC